MGNHLRELSESYPMNTNTGMGILWEESTQWELSNEYQCDRV